MIDLSVVSARMVDLENEIPEADPRDQVPVYEVLAKLAGIDPATPGLPEALVREVGRARQLANAFYGPMADAAPDRPEVLGTVAFLQGVTFARAVRDTTEESLADGELRVYLDEAITKWREHLGDLEEDTEPHLIARCYVDAFQSVRVSMLRELLP